MPDFEIKTIDLNQLAVPPEMFRLLPADIIKRHQVVPFRRRGGKISIAMSNPSNIQAVDEIRSLTTHDLEVFSADEEAIARALKRYFEGVKNMASKELEGFSPSESSVPRIVDKLFELALKYRASDIHLEPQVEAIFVRFRVDGVLEGIHQFPASLSAPIVSCIKVMAKLDITERRIPQDGQISTTVNGRDIGLRVSTVPGKYGETTVIRLLDRASDVVDIDKLGMDPTTRDRFEDVIVKPQGLVLVTGPTGSGKTTTLYAVLNLIRSSLKNIFTLEDPIECELLATSTKETGVTQVQVYSKIGLTFATGLRAALRQDPDVIMVGEIRDKETAEAAMKAAMTGHLVLSTLHTNDAASTIIRLRDIGCEPYLLGSTITGIMAQRLLRLLCSECKQPYTTPAHALGNLFPRTSLFSANSDPNSNLTLYRPVGCARCHGTGYWGRHGIFELLIVTEEIRTLIHEGGSAEAIKKAAQSDGLKTLRESGCKLVLEGLTTVEEVFRHTVD